MSRPLAVVSALALVSFASRVHADTAPAYVRETNAGVRFESGRVDAPPPGVTFTPGATLAGSVDVPGFGSSANVPNSNPAPSPNLRTPARSPNLDTAPVEAPSAPAPAATAAAIAPPPVIVEEPARAHVSRPAASVRPEDAAHAGMCRASNPTRHVTLDGAALRATHVALAADNERVVALVSMARPAPARQIREGLVYPEGRLVIDDGTEARVVRSIGTEPDSAIALLDGGRIAVVGYERLDRSAREARRESAITVAVIDSAGRTIVAPHRIEATEGLHIDSAVVRMRDDGFAVLLGRESTADDGSHGAVRESLFTFDSNGALAHEPMTVTDEQSDDTLAAHRVGLAGRDDGSMRMTWSISSGPRTGVWAARFDGSSLATPVRLFDRAAWGSEVSGDANGAFFRSGGERGEPVGLFYRSFEAGSRAVSLGAGWDPSVAFSRGWWLVAGVALQSPDGTSLESVMAAARPGEPLRAVVTPEVGEAAISDAVDLRMVGTRTGAAMAWIEAAESGGARRLGITRVTCP